MSWLECNHNLPKRTATETSWRENLTTFAAENRPVRVQVLKSTDKVVFLPFDIDEVWVQPPKLARQQYKNLCWRLTNLNAHLIPDIHLRKFKGGYHIDHIIPITYGFKNNINPHYIASLDNLRMLPERVNLDKGTRLTSEAIELLALWGL